MVSFINIEAFFGGFPGTTSIVIFELSNINGFADFVMNNKIDVCRIVNNRLIQSRNPYLIKKILSI